MSWFQHCRQLLHLPLWMGAKHFPVILKILLNHNLTFHRNAFLYTVLVQGQLLLAAPSTFVALSLIIKFFGTVSGSIYWSNFASRVGIQWLVSGVWWHDSRMFFKCQAPWRSPESCHRKNGRSFINTIIARTHLESLKASSRRFIAIFTFGNL